MSKINNTLALAIFATAFFSVSAANIFRAERPTYSEEEKRELARFPEFSVTSLTDGSFFSGIDNFISDTFISRTELISISRKINSLRSVNTVFGRDEDEIIFIPSKTVSDDTQTDSPIIFSENDFTDTETPTVDSEIQSDKDSDEMKNDENEPVSNPIDSENEEDTEKEPVVEKNPTEEPAPTDNLTEIDTPHGVGEPEYLSSGEIIYNGAVLSIPYLVPSIAQYYADVVSYYGKLFPEARVSTVCAPLSSAMITEPKLKNKITDQNKMINTINSYLAENINGVNCFEKLFEHRNEYLYFKSDHHWTSRGAYYAYAAFAESVGLEPTPIEEFTEVLMNSSWNGSMASMTGDDRIKEIKDEIYAYVPTKAHTMTTYSSNGDSNKYDTSILTNYKSYTGFIDGDNAYTVISVSENPKDMTCLVFKDSYGNAFVPYLVEHYSTIIVVDPRYIYFDVYEHLKDYPLTDIIFVNNLYNPNVLSYSKNLMRAVGK